MGGMTQESETASLADGRWLAHRHDYQRNAYRFVWAPREVQRAAIFATDEYLAADLPRRTVAAQEAGPALGKAPISFVFHSAFCCSTLMSRALDIEGAVTSLKEPMILNDLVGYALQGGPAEHLPRIANASLAMLQRPLGEDRCVVMKPSSVVNAFAPLLMQTRPEAPALFMYAPLPVFLGSIARKGLWGRLWVRELFTKLHRLGRVDLGFSEADFFQQSDLQIAAAGWLAQHKLFHALGRDVGAGRLRSLESETFTARPAQSLEAVARLFGLDLAEERVAMIAKGEAFRQHSKFGESFSAEEREAVRAREEDAHRDEIEKVSAWAAEVARGQGIAMAGPNPLLEG